MNTLFWQCARGMALVAGLLWAPLVTRAGPVDVTVASGPLGAGAFGLFNFTLERDVGLGELLKINTTGSNFNTEIALYDASGRMIATNDNIDPYNPLSELRFGADKALPAGDYTVVLSGFNTIFRTGDIVPGSSKGGDFQLNIQSTQPVQLPLRPSYLATDGHVLPSPIVETELGQGWLDARSVRQFDFFLVDDVLPRDWLVIHTQGSGFDTEIGLYDAQGKLQAKNDNINPGDRQSRLSFGLDGDNGRTLAAGAYTVLLGGFNTIFRDDLFAQSSLQYGGDFELYVQSSGRISMTEPPTPNPNSHTLTEPSTMFLMGMGMGVLMLMRRRQVSRVSAPKNLALPMAGDVAVGVHFPEGQLFQATKNVFMK